MVVVNFMSKPVAIRRESNDVAVGEISDDKSFSREGDVHRIRQSGRRIQRAEQIAECRVDEDGTICKELKKQII